MRAFMVVLLAGLLAGCSSPTDGEDDGETGTEHALDSATYGITVSDLPTVVLANSTFRFNSTISGGPVHASDHIGGHFGNKSTTEPSPAVYTVACAHVAGDLPGKYTVTCTAPTTTGVYYLRGHARITEGETVVNWWSTEQTFTIA
jgi:hypothetical protein